jgi:hypothetical protein
LVLPRNALIVEIIEKTTCYPGLSNVENPDTGCSHLQGFEKIKGSTRPTAASATVQ